jgi:hypothetical protein
MEYLLYMNLSDPLAGNPVYECNKGIETVRAKLEDLKHRGKTVRLVDTSQMDREALSTAYIRAAAVPATYGKYRVRTVFGTNRQPGIKFGTSVPALFVHDPSGEMAGDVYPHDKSGRYVTISEFLAELLAGLTNGGEATTPTKPNGRKRRK